MNYILLNNNVKMSHTYIIDNENYYKIEKNKIICKSMIV